jgi:hypothetical protein
MLIQFVKPTLVGTHSFAADECLYEPDPDRAAALVRDGSAVVATQPEKLQTATVPPAAIETATDPLASPATTK